MTQRLTTRSIATAQAIRDRENFVTSGSMHGEGLTTSNYVYSGHLNDKEAEVLRVDSMAGVIDYVVWSYSTPIAWHRTDGTWHKVSQKFSRTTTKHQGNLYLCDSTEVGAR